MKHFYFKVLRVVPVLNTKVNPFSSSLLCCRCCLGQMGVGTMFCHLRAGCENRHQVMHQWRLRRRNNQDCRLPAWSVSWFVWEQICFKFNSYLFSIRTMCFFVLIVNCSLVRILFHLNKLVKCYMKVLKRVMRGTNDISKLVCFIWKINNKNQYQLS